MPSRATSSRATSSRAGAGRHRSPRQSTGSVDLDDAVAQLARVVKAAVTRGMPIARSMIRVRQTTALRRGVRKSYREKPMYQHIHDAHGKQAAEDWVGGRIIKDGHYRNGIVRPAHTRRHPHVALREKIIDALCDAIQNSGARIVRQAKADAYDEGVEAATGDA